MDFKAKHLENLQSFQRSLPRIGKHIMTLRGSLRKARRTPNGDVTVSLSQSALSDLREIERTLTKLQVATDTLALQLGEDIAELIAPGLVPKE